VTSPNRTERTALNAVGMRCSDGIEAAADGCPVEVIRFITA
jgi:hypothetical protein